MPFKSKAQVRHMFRNHPDVATKMLSDTLDIRRLPEHVKPKKTNGKNKAK